MLRTVGLFAMLLTMAAGFLLVGSASPAAAQSSPNCQPVSASQDSAIVKWDYVGAEGTSYRVWRNGKVLANITDWIQNSYYDYAAAGSTGTFHYSVDSTVNGITSARTYCGKVTYGTPLSSCSVQKLNDGEGVVSTTRQLGSNEIYRIYRNGKKLGADDRNDQRTPLLAGVNHFSLSLEKLNDNGQVLSASPRVYCGKVVTQVSLTPSSCWVTQVNGKIRVNWNGNSGADAVRVIRLGKPFGQAQSGATSLDDGSTRAGTRYHYSVVGMVDTNPTFIPQYEDRGPARYCGSRMGIN